MSRYQSRPLHTIPARKVNSITVKHNPDGTSRWNSANWLQTDYVNITEMHGMLPANHLSSRSDPRKCFMRWLEASVQPSTIDWIMSNETAYSTSYSAYLGLARCQADLKRKAKTNETTNSSNTADEAEKVSIND